MAANAPRDRDGKIIAGALSTVLATALTIAGTPLLAASTVKEGDLGREESRSATIGRARIELSAGCMECHRINAIYNHPVEIVPSMPVPEELPLFEGWMTCVTCHEYQVLDREHSVDPGGNHWLRSQSNPSNLCVRCHDVTSIEVAQVHAVNLNKAHLSWIDFPSGSETPYPAHGRFDQESQNCLSCHDY